MRLRCNPRERIPDFLAGPFPRSGVDGNQALVDAPSAPPSLGHAARHDGFKQMP